MHDETKKNESYRRILASAHKLEIIQRNLESVIDFFSVPIVKLYSKLSHDCLKLLFECDFKLDQYRKAEELLWRRIYYDIYRFQKTNRHKIKRQDELLIESHLVSGIGFYSTFIVKLRSHYKIHDVRGLPPPFNLSLGPIDNFIADKRLNDDDLCAPAISIHASSTSAAGSSCKPVDQESAESWARLAIYRSLVYIGDLARYLLETDHAFDYRKLAYEFYLSASRNQPDYGLPYNQLATLAGGQNNNLDAVCNYMRCCLSQRPFERAEANMRCLFELNSKSHNELEKKKLIPSVSEVFASKEPRLAAEAMVHIVVVKFIKLTSDLWLAILNNSSESALMKLIAEETRTFFECLREALELEPIVPMTHSSQSSPVQAFEPISDGSYSREQPRYITASIMYEYCSISIMLIAKFERWSCRDAGGERKVKNTDLADLVHALALNLLYYSTSKCQKMIISKLQELRINQVDHENSHKTSNTLNDSYNALAGRSNENICNTATTTYASDRKSLSRLRQREAASNYLDRSRVTSISQNDDSDMSELEETALSTIDALEISSDMSEDADRQMNDLIDLGSSSGDETGSSVATTTTPANALLGRPMGNLSGSGKLSRSVLRPTRSQNYSEIVHARPQHLYGSTNSLPIQDLVTGDIGERLDIRPLNSTRCSPFVCSSNSSCNQDSIRDQLRGSPASSSDYTELSGSGHCMVREIDQAYAFVYRQTYLPTIKIFCDWLLSNGHIISHNLSSFRAFCTELESLESLLEDLEKVARSKDGTTLTTDTNNFSTSHDDDYDNLIQNHAFKGPTWKQRYPLSCDYPLINLEPVRSTHSMNVDFLSCRRELTDCESGFLSIQCVKAFCHALSIFLRNKDLE